MNRKHLRPCNKIGCVNLTREGYCDVHKIVVEKQQKREANKRYDKSKRNQKAKRFYASADWQKMKQIIFNRDNGLCQQCLDNDEIVAGEVVHHKVELLDGKRGWELRLEPSNLITLCHSCHNKIHKGE